MNVSFEYYPVSEELMHSDLFRNALYLGKYRTTYVSVTVYLPANLPPTCKVLMCLCIGQW